MIQDQGFFICRTCGERVLDSAGHSAAAPSLPFVNTLHLDSLHETFGSAESCPGDQDAEFLLDTYLDHLCTQNAGIEWTLGQIGTLMYNERSPSLSVAKADEWLAEWRNSGNVAGRSTNLNPIEELVSASLLLRPAEHGVVANRQLVAFQFCHQNLCERVLLRELHRQIHPRSLPTGKELTDWVRQIVGPSKSGQGNATEEPFKELLGAVQSMIKKIILSGAADVFAALLPIEPEEIRSQVILGGLLKSQLKVRIEQFEIFLQNLTEHAKRKPEVADGLINALASPLDNLGHRSRGLSLLERRFWEAAIKIMRARIEAEPHNAERKEDLSVSLLRLGSLCKLEEDWQSARAFFEEALQVRRALAEDSPDQLGRKQSLSISLTHLAHLSAGEDDDQTARALFEEALLIRRALVAADPQRVSYKRALSESLNHLGRVSDAQTANALFEEATAIASTLVAAEPQRTSLKMNLSFSLRCLGRLSWQEGHSQTARALFVEALQLDRALSAVAPHRTDHKIDMCCSLDYLVEISARDGGLRAARAFFEEGLPLQRELVAAYPRQANRKQHLSEILHYLGELSDQDGDTQAAVAFFKEAIQIDCGLVATGPHQGRHHSLLKAHLHRNFSIPLIFLGESSIQQGDTETARALFEEAIRVDRVLVAADHYRAYREENLSSSLDRLGCLYEKEGNVQAACSLFEESLQLKRTLLAEAPTNLPLLRQIAKIERSLSKLASNS